VVAHCGCVEVAARSRTLRAACIEVLDARAVSRITWRVRAVRLVTHRQLVLRPAFARTAVFIATCQTEEIAHPWLGFPFVRRSRVAIGTGELWGNTGALPGIPEREHSGMDRIARRGAAWVRMRASRQPPFTSSVRCRSEIVSCHGATKLTTIKSSGRPRRPSARLFHMYLLYSPLRWFFARSRSAIQSLQFMGARLHKRLTSLGIGCWAVLSG